MTYYITGLNHWNAHLNAGVRIIKRVKLHSASIFPNGKTGIAFTPYYQ